jgi:putative addiction module CopG family antidote
MEVHIAPDQEEFIHRRVLNGRFPSAEEAVREAVSLLEEREIREETARPAPRRSLARLFAESPFRGLDLDFPRQKNPLRAVDLCLSSC